MCDNTSAINISKNSVMHSRTKHIAIQYHFLKEKVAEGEVKLEFISTSEQVADIFTKPLPKEVFEYLQKKLGVVTLPKHWLAFGRTILGRVILYFFFFLLYNYVLLYTDLHLSIVYMDSGGVHDIPLYLLSKGGEE